MDLNFYHLQCICGVLAAFTTSLCNNLTHRTSLHTKCQMADAEQEQQKLIEENREMEIHARKAKSRAENDLESAINSFDVEMEGHEKEYQEALGVYEELQRQIEVMDLCCFCWTCECHTVCEPISEHSYHCQNRFSTFHM